MPVISAISSAINPIRVLPEAKPYKRTRTALINFLRKNLLILGYPSDTFTFSYRYRLVIAVPGVPFAPLKTLID